MGIFRVIFELFVLYLLYKLIFDFIIPLYQASVQVKKKMGEMQHRMNEQTKQQQGTAAGTGTKEPSAKPKKEDYIEFEEVK